MRNARVGWTVLALLLSGLTGCAAADVRTPRHLIYLHGRIVQEEQSARPRHPEYGYYELEKILQTFRDRGFVVSGEIRPKSASVSDSANRVVEQIRQLVASGVPADHVTVVGGSMGASIALLASARLKNPDVSFCVLGACLSANVRGLVADEGQGPIGRVLSIREASDDGADSCPPWNNDLEPGSSLVAREIVLHTGLKHGFLYRPLPEWVDPVVEWANAETVHQAAEQPMPVDGTSREH
jgi:pimeloyl-ACP methyl ester carboxylesterase